MPISISDIVSRSAQLANQRQGLATQTASSLSSAGLKAAANDIASLSAMSAARARTAQINKSAAEVAALREEMAMKRKKAPLELSRLSQLLDQSAENQALGTAAKKMALFEAQQTQDARIQSRNLAPQLQQEQLTGMKLSNQEAADKHPLNQVLTEIQTQMANNQLENMPESIAIANLMLQDQKGTLEKHISGRKWDTAVKKLTGVSEAASSGNMDRANLIYKSVKPVLDDLTGGMMDLPASLNENNIGVVSNLMGMATTSVKYLQELGKTEGTTKFNRLVKIVDQIRKNNRQNRTIQNDIKMDIRSDTIGITGSELDSKGNYLKRKDLAQYTDAIETFFYKHFGKDYKEAWQKVLPLLVKEDAPGIGSGDILAIDSPDYMDNLDTTYERAVKEGKAKDTKTGYKEFAKKFLLANIAKLTGKI